MASPLHITIFVGMHPGVDKLGIDASFERRSFEREAMAGVEDLLVDTTIGYLDPPSSSDDQLATNVTNPNDE